MLAGAVSGGVAAVGGCLSDSSGRPDDNSSVSIALEDDPTADSWDTYGYVTPYFTKVVEPLIWATESMEPTPWLATGWEAVDETTWSVTLRENVSFHNGEEMTATDVVWSFERLFERGQFVSGWLHLEPENVVAVDEYTVEFTNTEPFPAFPGTIAHNMICVQHPDSTADDLGTIGTGPLTIEAVDRGSTVETSPFADYWQDGVEVPLSFEVIEDPSTRALSLESDDVDVIFNPPRNRVEPMRDDPSLSVLTQQSSRTMFLPCNLYRPPTDDARLRRALNYAVSQSELVDTVLEGIDDPARGPISPIVHWSAHDGLRTYDRDLDRARELVEQSDYDGEPLVLAVNASVVSGELIAEAVAGAFTEIGVETDITVVDPGSYNEYVQAGNAHLGLQTSGSNSAAADYIMFENFHSEGVSNAQLFEAEGTGVSNPGKAVDELIETAYQSRNAETTATAYRDAQHRLVEEAVCLPICHVVHVIAARTEIEGIDPHPIDKMVDWSDLSREER
ncbi:ABC transporter substrate-binding protein [Natrarchaeobius halalkaliphilus]|uniref:ABC transporter substrate-binding protein n=2 Tax=Natrarchaeobius halalkaliphilus TaxID=1679091 RepID=A0A3N6NVZ6_9EURY|nr:ABC transporter substrate-binding protein [Natrarchaeobius halalkaliphilus]